jgi:hypothetical protein
MSVTERDYELISAYLDGELTAAEQAEVEARLQNDAELRRELQSLRQTVTLIQQLPARSAPRNFTLDAHLFRKPALPFPLTITFSALSTAAAILLFVFGGYFLLQTELRQQTASSAPQQQAAQSIAPTQQAEAVAILPTATALSSQAASSATPAVQGTPMAEMSQNIAPSQQAGTILMQPTATAMPSRTAPPAIPAAQGSPTAETETQAQMAQLADRERDETAATESESAADDAGSTGLFATGENAQAPPASDALEERLNKSETPAALDSTTSSGVMGGGAMATAAAPSIARPLPTAIAAGDSADAPETGFRAIPPGEGYAAAEIPADGVGTDLADADNEGADGRVDTLLRQETPVVDNRRGIIGAGLLVAGAILLVAAFLTTIARQRRLRP